jgi:glucokinase
VVDGRIFHGATPGEVEIGHVRLDPAGTIVENRCSGWAVDRRIKEAIEGEPGSVLAKLVRDSHPGGEARHLPGALAANDRWQSPSSTSMATHSALPLATLFTSCIRISLSSGGGLTFLGEEIRSRVAAVLPRHLMDAFQPGPEVVLAALGEDAVPVGALALAATAVRA